MTGGHGLGQGWMGMGHIGLGALWSCGGRDDSWWGLPEQDVVAQGVGWWQLVCSGLAAGDGKGRVEKSSGWVLTPLGTISGLAGCLLSTLRLRGISVRKNVPGQP